MTNGSLTLNGYKWNVESEEEQQELLSAIMKRFIGKQDD